MKLNKLIEILEFFYPSDLAESWDNVGLQIGDERTSVDRVMTSLEITNDVIDEAIERGADLIICHHPIIFKPISNLNFKSPQSRMIAKLIKNNIAVYVMHTNVDISSNGMNDWLAQVLEMKSVSILKNLKTKNYKKVILSASKNQLNDAITALKLSGCGQKGDVLSEHSIVEKERHIRMLDEKKINEKYFEVTSYILDENVNELHKNLNKSFTYEIYNIENVHQLYGLGRVGTIKPVSLEQFAERIKDLFSLDHVRLVGDREDIIKKVAIVGGSGSDFIIDAKLKSCDVIITGDIGFHDAQLALASKINIIDPGHNIEIIFNDVMSDFINLFDEVTCFASEVDTNPFEVI